MMVYALIDPRSDQIRYVGKTMRSLAHRLRRHLFNSNIYGDETYKNRWLRQLIRCSLTPRIILLQACSSTAELNEAERNHIQRLRRAGARLTNISPGGDGGGGKHTKKTKEKISRSHKGKIKTAEHRANLSAAKIGKKASAETRAKLSGVQSARYRPPMSKEHRIAVRDGCGRFPIVDQHGRIYESQNAAARDLALDTSHIGKVIRGQRSHTGGYIFKKVRQWPQ